MTHPPTSPGDGSDDPAPGEDRAASPPGYYQSPPGYYPPPPGQYPTPPPPTWGPPAFGLSPQDERTWGMLAHIGALVAGFVVGLAFLGPLIVMFTQGTKSAFVRRHAVESLNFQLTLLIAGIVGSVLAVVAVIGGIKAHHGEEYRYPINIRMVT